MLRVEVVHTIAVGDKINPKDTWILILNHLGVTSWTFVTTQQRKII
jgi:hypothetical protein